MAVSFLPRKKLVRTLTVITYIKSSFTFICNLLGDQLKVFAAKTVAVAQRVDWLFPIPDARGSNPVIGKNLK